MDQIKRSEILDEEMVCVYCMQTQTGFSCCGENHFETAYITKDSAYLFSDTEVKENE